MKKAIFLLILMLVVMLAGCSSGPDYKVSITKPVYFVKDKATPFEVKVTENGKEAKGLKITAHFEMSQMDHGSADAKLAEGENGKYTGKAALPMDGKYEITFTILAADKSKADKTIDYTVKKAEGVATINGQWIKQEDVQFYQLVNKLQLALNREAAKQKYSGDALKEELSYIDSQEKSEADSNQLLTQIIRIRAMALLSEQRGNKAAPADIQAAITKDNVQYDQNPAAQQLISQFGEAKFKTLEEKEYNYTILEKQIMSELVAQAKKKNPNVNDQEINYQAQQDYEDLLVSQMNSLKIQIL